jgi:hypothetical protein
VPSASPPLFDLFSHAQAGPGASKGFSAAQVGQIRHTIRRLPEVMVKVTGGGRKVHAVAEHLSYISHHGELELETDEGERVSRDGLKELLRDWHLELSAGQYRPRRDGATGKTRIKLVHNIVLSMPAPTPPEKVLAAAKIFAREKFALRHRYAMALHTHQQHPHVHLVVKAEGSHGRRLHIDKAMLREWREDFARMMRDQGIAANATPRAVRGQIKRGERDAFYRTRRRGRSEALHERIGSIASELASTRTIRDPARARLIETRKALLAGWMGVASTLEAQGESALARDVRSFAKTLPPVLTDRERLATEFIRYVKDQKTREMSKGELVRDRTEEFTR